MNLAKKVTEVDLCEIYAVEKASEGEKVIILDVCTAVSLAEMSWVQIFLKEFGMKLKT